MKKAIIALFSMLFLFSCSRMLIYSPDRIKAYTTSDPGRPYKALGKVETVYVPSGFSKKTAQLFSVERNFEKYGDTKKHRRQWTEETHPDLKPDYQEANRYLLDRAYDQFGSVLGAVINVRYTNYVEYYNKDGVIDYNLQRMCTKAIGLAVCFVDHQNKCINFDKSDASPESPSGSKVINKDSIIIVENEEEEEKRPAPQAELPPEKILIPDNILGNPLKDSRTETEYGQTIDGLKKGHEYDYGAFFIRILEFNSSKAATSFLTTTSKLTNVKKVKTGFYWLSNFANCKTCSNLVFQLDSVKIISIYPNDQTLDTAIKVSKALKKK